MLLMLFAVMLVGLSAPVSATSDEALSELDELRQNVSALWAEVAALREEVANHHHGGHLEPDHDRIVMDVGVMQHEDHIHHQHTADQVQRHHPYHHLHHSHDALAHLDQHHNHTPSSIRAHLDEHDEHHYHADTSTQQPQENHSREQDHSHDHGDHSHDHGDHSHDHGDHSHNHGDHSHDHGDHSHDHGDHSHDHGDHSHDHGDSHEQGDHSHDHGDSHEQGDHAHNHGKHPHNHADHSHDHKDAHGHDDHAGHHHAAGEAHERCVHCSHHRHHSHADMHVEVIASDPKLSLDNNDGHPHHDNHHHNHLPPDHIYHPRNQKDVIKATCDLRPNTAPGPFNLVRGNITITQKKNEEGPVYFDLTIPGFRMNSVSEAVFGFHVHERPVTNGDCSSAGGHFNPHDSVHGGPTDEIRHVGDLGNVVIPEGGLDGYLIVDHSVAFSGEDSIVGKSIVMHADTDDLGRGGDKGSQATGNAGARISCCTIHLVPEPRFRFG